MELLLLTFFIAKGLGPICFPLDGIFTFNSIFFSESAEVDAVARALFSVCFLDLASFLTSF